MGSSAHKPSQETFSKAMAKCPFCKNWSEDCTIGNLMGMIGIPESTIMDYEGYDEENNTWRFNITKIGEPKYGTKKSFK